MLFGSFLTFSAIWGRRLGELFLVSSCPSTPLSAGAGLGNHAAPLWHRTRFQRFRVVWGGSWRISSCLHPPLSAELWSASSGHSIVTQGYRFVVFFSFSSCRPPPARRRGRSGYFGYSDCGTGLCDFLFSLFRWFNFASPSFAKVVALLRFSAFPLTHSRPAPLADDTAVVFFDVFPEPYG